MSSQIRKDKRNTEITPTSRVGRVKRSRFKKLDQLDHDTHSNQDLWHPQQRGEEYRYARHPRAPKGKVAYQQALALKQQQVTHAPFYMESLGQTETAINESQTTQHSVSQVSHYTAPTRFYPHGGEDSLSAIQPVGRVQLQRVLPSYEISTAETRESGLGPSLESILYHRKK